MMAILRKAYPSTHPSVRLITVLTRVERSLRDKHCLHRLVAYRYRSHSPELPLWTVTLLLRNLQARCRKGVF